MRQRFCRYIHRLRRRLFLSAGNKTQCGPDLQFPGYEAFWNYAERKGYSGTAIFSRHKPLSVTYGIGIAEHDSEGRVITLEMPEFFLVTVYTPNSKDGLLRLDYRMEWEAAFREYLLGLDARKPVIVCGDMNVAHKEIDLKNPSTNSFRHLYPDLEGAYSWWSYRMRARERNAGWRIDYFLVSDRLADKINEARIHNNIFGSDHCPVEVEMNL